MRKPRVGKGVKYTVRRGRGTGDLCLASRFTHALAGARIRTASVPVAVSTLKTAASQRQRPNPQIATHTPHAQPQGRGWSDGMCCRDAHAEDGSTDDLDVRCWASCDSENIFWKLLRPQRVDALC